MNFTSGGGPLSNDPARELARTKALLEQANGRLKQIDEATAQLGIVVKRFETDGRQRAIVRVVGGPSFECAAPPDAEVADVYRVNNDGRMASKLTNYREGIVAKVIKVLPGGYAEVQYKVGLAGIFVVKPGIPSS